MPAPKAVPMPPTAELIGRDGRQSAVARATLRVGSAVARAASRAVLGALYKAQRTLGREVHGAAPKREPSRVAPAPRRVGTANDRPGNGHGLVREERIARKAPSPGGRPLTDLPRIALVNPPRFNGIPVTRLFRSEYLFVQGNQVPAMDLAYFAAAAKGRAVLSIIEANGEDLTTREVVERLEAFRPDVIVQKGVLNILHQDLAASDTYKKTHPNVRIVLSCRGCIDAEEAVFEEFPFVDAIARGEIDAFARDIAARPNLVDIEGLSLPDRRTRVIRVVEDLDEVPLPDLQLMPRLWHSGFTLFYYGVPSGYFLTTSRGCPYTCTFCMVGGIDGRPFRYRKRDPYNVAEEAKLLRRSYGVRDFYVFDEIFTMPGHGERVCERWIEEDIGAQWICEGKPDLVTPSMLATMKRAGCLAVYYGIESGDDGILRSIEKGHTTDDARRAIDITRSAGILAGAYAMLGFPGETVRTYLETVGFLLETRPDLLRYDFLLPYPVTVLHKEMVESGLLKGGKRGLDRNISPHHDEKILYRTKALRPTTLKAMELLLKQGFARELRRSPVPVARGA